jgi:hypothetical protein
MGRGRARVTPDWRLKAFDPGIPFWKAETVGGGIYAAWRDTGSSASWGDEEVTAAWRALPNPWTHPAESPVPIFGSSPGCRGGLIEASYLTHRQYAAQFRLIVDVLLAQQQHTLTGIAAADLPGLLRGHVVKSGADPAVLDDPGFNLKSRMADLKRWRVIHIFQDRVTRDADFVLDFDRYQLTETAAQLHRAVLALGEDVASGAAATLAPGVLTAQLTVLSAAAGADPVAAAAAWAVIQTTYRAMADAAATWQARLAGALAGTPDQRKVTVVQETRSLQLLGLPPSIQAVPSRRYRALGPSFQGPARSG